MSTIDKNNYQISTFGIFEKCNIPVEKPHYISKSGSAYWVFDDYMVRDSDHWGEVSSCYWILQNGEHVGMIKYSDMKKIQLYTTSTFEDLFEECDGFYETIDELKEYYKEVTPDMIGKCNVAVEFGSLQLCTFTSDSILDDHPNHKRDTVSIVEGIDTKWIFEQTGIEMQLASYYLSGISYDNGVEYTSEIWPGISLYDFREKVSRLPNVEIYVKCNQENKIKIPPLDYIMNLGLKKSCFEYESKIIEAWDKFNTMDKNQDNLIALSVCQKLIREIE